MLATTSPVLQMLNEQLDVMTLSPIERQLYESRMKLKSDITTISESQYYAGREEGIQQGIQQGMMQGEAKGKLEGKLETAKNLLAMGLSIENIAKATGLTVQEVESARSVCQDD